mmetsp:Transcript_56593/g.127708  ORF Transcript_56593/g.127708 Transcript_56593/m.127708 type:complete len:118 (+) Transcript_56593:221-574(+)
MTLTDKGITSVSGEAMVKVLRPFFREGSYDLLRKNCNCFSDCALFYLLGRRLEGKYKVLEQLCEYMERNAGLVRLLSLGDYTQNPEADSFDQVQVLRIIAKLIDPHERLDPMWLPDD